MKRLLALTIPLLLMSACRAQTDSKQPAETVARDTVQATALPAESDSLACKDSIPHEGFVYVKDLIPDLVEDLRYATDNNFMGERADGYEANRAIMTRQAAQALKEAADELREMGYLVKVYDAYRPQQAVDHFVRWSKTKDQRNKATYYPTLDKASLFGRYIARRSGHSKGSTIDMTICYKESGEEVDMGSHFDFFGPPSHTMFLGKYSGGNVTKKHQENRLMLQNVMTKHGFKPYTNEWWHFTLKDEPFPQTWFGFPIK